MRILIITHSDTYPDNAVTRDLSARGHSLYWRRPLLNEALPRLEKGQGSDAVDAVVSFGGPQFVTEIDTMPWMQMEVEWVRDFVSQGGFFLGVCLGAQILAHAFGGKIWRFPDETSEVGVYRVTPTVAARDSGFMEEPGAFYQFHLEGFECPHGATLLATSDLFPNQAFRLGERAYGLQFHPEINAQIIKKWTASVSANKPEVFRRPNVRPADRHLPEWIPHENRISRWRRNFLQSWLAA